VVSSHREPIDGAALLIVSDWFLTRKLPATVRFSGVADAQLRLDVREYAAVHGCLRALTAAVVAVTVAVGDTNRPSASKAGSQARAITLHTASPAFDSLASASSSRSQRAMWPTTTLTPSDLPRTVRGRPLASARACGGCYSFSYSPAMGPLDDS
jgi:hypothetical protein